MPRDLLAPAAGPRDLLAAPVEYQKRRAGPSPEDAAIVPPDDGRQLTGSNRYGEKVYQPNEIPGIGPDPNAHLRGTGSTAWDDPSQTSPMYSDDPRSPAYNPEMAQRGAEVSADAQQRGAALAGKRPPVPSVGRSFMRGAEQGLSARFSDEIIPMATTGFGIWGDYGEEVLRHRDRYAEALRAHPVAYGAGEIAGSVPLAAVPGGNAIRAGSMGQKVAAGARVGAIQGGMMEAGGAEGMPWERIDDAAKGAISGAAVGVVGAPASAYVGNTARTAAGYLRGNSGRPATLLADNAVDQGRIASEIARNPRLSPADVDTGAQQLLQGVVGETPGARKVATEQITRQTSEMPGMIRGAMDNAAGATPDSSATLQRLMDEAKANAQAGFRPTLASMGPVDTRRVVSSIDLIASRSRQEGGGAFTPRGSPNEIRPSEEHLLRFREQLAGVSDPNRLHQIQTDMRLAAEQLKASTNPADRQAAGAINRLRQELIDDMDAAVGGAAGKPGAYRQAQRQFADDMQVREAFTKGLDIFRNRAGAAGVEDEPGAWRAMVADMSEAERNALAEGTRAAMSRSMGTVRNAARSGAEVPQIEYNRAKLEAVLGKAETDQMISVLEDAQRVARKSTRIIGSSETASREAARQQVKEPEVRRLMLGDLAAPGIGYATGGWTGLAVGGAAALANRGLQGAKRGAVRSENVRLAKALSGTGPNAVADLNSLAVAPKSPAEIERLVRALLLSSGNAQVAPAGRSMVERAFGG